MEFHRNFLDLKFKDPNFLKKFITLEDAEIIFNKYLLDILNSKRSGIYKVWYINPNLT